LPQGLLGHDVPLVKLPAETTPESLP